MKLIFILLSAVLPRILEISADLLASDGKLGVLCR